MSMTSMGDVQAAVERLRAAIATQIVGQEAVVDEVLIALFAGGHVLLEGAPGLGKTMLVRTLADALALRFSRIQFTPDLMPSDIVGTNVVTEGTDGRRHFELARGPIFGQLVLADEINRATPKTQSALLEAMAERTVTIAGQRHELEEPFFVLATENPIEMEGTYPLPEAQLDRFLFKTLMRAPDEPTLLAILTRTTGRLAERAPAVLRAADLLSARTMVRDVAIAEPIARYVARLVRATDPTSETASPDVKRWVRFGAGVRAAQSIVLAAKACALLAGKSHVGPSHVKRVALPALRHRIVPTFEAEADGRTPDAIVQAVVDAVPSLDADAAALAS